MGEFEFMDMLFQKYACPFEFMNIYIENGQFGEWVSEIIEINAKERKEKADSDNEEKLWQLYLHSFPDKSFDEWKEQMTNQSHPVSLSMNSEEIEKQKEKSRKILKNFAPQ